MKAYLIAYTGTKGKNQWNTGDFYAGTSTEENYGLWSFHRWTNNPGEARWFDSVAKAREVKQKLKVPGRVQRIE